MKSSWPCSIQKNAEFKEIRTAQWRELHLGQTNHEAKLRKFPAGSMAGGCVPVACCKVPSIGPERENTPWGKPGERYKHRWGKVRQASRWWPWQFRPSTTYGALPPHTRCSITITWPLKAKSSAMPGLHATGLANESRGWIQLLLCPEYLL